MKGWITLALVLRPVILAVMPFFVEEDVVVWKIFLIILSLWTHNTSHGYGLIQHDQSVLSFPSSDGRFWENFGTRPSGTSPNKGPEDGRGGGENLVPPNQVRRP